VWRGFALDPGARDVPEHLMLWLGEQVRRHGPEVADPREPRARRSFARGGAGANGLLGRAVVVVCH
jgi:hypothetical protein